jgi:hypothetical protein
LGILFSSILCTCPNQRNLRSLIVSVMVIPSNKTYIQYLINNLNYLSKQNMRHNSGSGVGQV